MIARLFGLRTISPRDLHAALGAVTVIDVNDPGRFGARVPGARVLDPAAFGEADLPTDRGARLVFYCSNPLCRKAPLAAKRAAKLGFKDVAVMSAGMKGWLDAGLPVER